MNSRGARNTIAVILVAIGIIALLQYPFGGSKSEAYAHTLQPSDAMREIRIESDSLALDVNFITSGSDAVRVEGKAGPKVIEQIESAKVENGVLKLRFKEKWRWGFFNFSGWNTKQVITISLTAETMESLESVTVNSDSGSVRVNGDLPPKAVITADSGSIRMGSLQGGDLTVKADSGSIQLDSFEGSSLSVTSDSGSIQAGKVHAKLKAVSDSGSVKIDRLTGVSEIKTDSGSIRIVKDDETGAVVTSDSGSVRITVPASFSGAYDLKSDSGSIHNPDPVGTSGQLIKVRTDSGSIRIIQ